MTSMPDIREVLKALDEKDRLLWNDWRTNMRRTYLMAHNRIVGVDSYDHSDDAFMDYIDIRLALLFDSAGRMSKAVEHVTEQAAKELEAGLDNMYSNMKSNPVAVASDAVATATTIPANEWKP